MPQAAPGETPTATPVPTPPTPTPTPTPVPLVQLSFSDVRAVGRTPSLVEIAFSLRDDDGRSVVLQAGQLQAATRIFESGPGTGGGWEEIDYTETSFFVRAAEDLQLEMIVVLDFTNSMAQARLPDGRSGIQVMLDAFEQAIVGLPEGHRIGVVEFHDRNVDPGVLSALTTDRDAVLGSVRAFAGSLFEPGSSRMWDSIQTAASLFTNREENRNVVRALVFISDGRDTSSDRTRSDAAGIADDNDIQLYAVGVGDVHERDELEELVQSTGGGYYPAVELDALQDQLRVLVSDLQGQYRVSYTTLRRQGPYRTRINLDLPWATGALETKALEVSAFYAADTQGRLAIDPPSVDSSKGEVKVLFRALRVPRNIERFRFKLDTDKPQRVGVVAREDGGLLDGWDVSGPDIHGYFQVFSTEPLEFGVSGPLFHVTLSDFTEGRIDIPVAFDNSIYPEGKSFTYPEAIQVGERILPFGHIAFRSTRDGNEEIYVMGVDGANQRNLTNSAFGEFLPSWSPDGQHIAFDSDRDGNREIYVMDADGANQTRLTEALGDDWWPAWSPDGARIAFTSNRSGNGDIWVMNADGTEQSPLTSHPAGDFRPAWSPDAQSIAFYSVRDGNREVYLMNADGAGQRNLSNHPGDDWYPAWSPGGAHIAFASLRDGNSEVYVMYADGTIQTNITNHPASDQAPAWGP